MLAVPFDLGDRAIDGAELVDRVEAELGPVDILVNNAAAGGYKPFMEWTDRVDREGPAAELLGAVAARAPVLPGMRCTRGGWIINCLSAAAMAPTGPPFPPTAPASLGTIYGGTKAFLDRWTVSLAAEVWDDGIAVNTLAPQAAAATEVLLEYSDIPTSCTSPSRPWRRPPSPWRRPTRACSPVGSPTAWSCSTSSDGPTLDLTGTTPLEEWSPDRLAERMELMRANALGVREGQGRSNVADLGAGLREPG